MGGAHGDDVGTLSSSGALAVRLAGKDTMSDAVQSARGMAAALGVAVRLVATRKGAHRRAWTSDAQGTGRYPSRPSRGGTRQKLAGPDPFRVTLTVNYSVGLPARSRGGSLVVGPCACAKPAAGRVWLHTTCHCRIPRPGGVGAPGCGHTHTRYGFTDTATSTSAAAGGGAPPPLPPIFIRAKNSGLNSTVTGRGAARGSFSVQWGSALL